MPVSNGGGDGMRTAETALRRYGTRRWMECLFRALGRETGMKDRGPAAAGDLRGCPAFDAVTALRVRDPRLPARENPDGPAERRVGAESGGAVVTHAACGRVIEPGAPPEPDMTVARCVTPVACPAGFGSGRLQPMPGTRKPWRGPRILNVAGTHARVMRPRTGRKPEYG